MNLSAFVLASAVLAVTPGPGVLYIVARTLAQGRAAGLASVAGVAIGNAANALGAVIGLAALFALSSAAFTAIKLAGAAYLVWLGVKALRAPPADGSAMAAALPARRIFRDGLVVALLNPKTALFFVAFLPQFMTPDSRHALQGALPGMTFVAIAAATDTAWVLAASVAAPALARWRGAGRAGRWASGSAFIGLGLWAAASGSPVPGPR